MIQTNRRAKQKRQPTVELLELFPYQGEWIESDYFKLPETNRIIELSEGRLIITPLPTDQHQKIMGKLYFLICNYLLGKNIGEARFAPLDVRLGKDNIRQPDIVFMTMNIKTGSPKGSGMCQILLWKYYQNIRLKRTG